ncbi:Transcription factor bHLH96 [Quillaja saponaria]|uniref:Transcription factor bHLH96 n=1 Tax=Quillaja saponaria TaxID=32244 RepID=A0AAD7VEZ8_QUISA|nr:Transcription factor bHLH96 [Quillaja saponaria]
MALETVVFPQDLLGYGSKDFYSLLGNGGANWSYDQFNLEEEEEKQVSLEFAENQTESYAYGADWNSSSSSMGLFSHFNEFHLSSDTINNAINSPAQAQVQAQGEVQQLNTSTTMPARPKRRRAKTRKNKEEIENQRITHIAVERNRRKQMNKYLSVLRSLMPDSYVQRVDQASIIGAAINFVKELEHRLQFLGTQKETEGKSNVGPVMPFSDFFTFPQYSTSSSGRENSVAMGDQVGQGEVESGVADVEVTMVESHANLKIRSQRRPKQLLKIVSGLHSMRLTILHLNVTTTGEIVLYSLSVKVEDDCKLGSVDEIAKAVYQMLDGIQQEAMN